MWSWKNRSHLNHSLSFRTHGTWLFLNNIFCHTLKLLDWIQTTQTPFRVVAIVFPSSNSWVIDIQSQKSNNKFVSHSNESNYSIQIEHFTLLFRLLIRWFFQLANTQYHLCWWFLFILWLNTQTHRDHQEMIWYSE